MAFLPRTAPVLSTPDTHIFNETSPIVENERTEKVSDAQLEIRYEIRRTIAEIKLRSWNRVALQFPDDMLLDSARVSQLLAHGLDVGSTHSTTSSTSSRATGYSSSDELASSTRSMTIEDKTPIKLTILADTSYGSCCVDEIAAEHVEADAVVHYGRACLSPTVRLPVLHIFTKQDLDHTFVVKTFTETFEDRDTKIILTADVTYASHVQPIYELLVSRGYSNVFPAKIIHDPSSPVPNRTVPDSVNTNPAELQNYQLFHISDPPTSLLLTLSSRVASVHICPTAPSSSTSPSATLASTTSLLRRRYALVTSLSTISTWGILINTLSVKNYLDIVEHVKKQIFEAGKKSYLFVVGKLNAAKVANFSEVGGWVVIGCWESSLIDSKDFYRPVVTPFELGMALQSDSERLWTGQWRSDFQSVFDHGGIDNGQSDGEDFAEDTGEGDYDSEEESTPPVFDLRTGKYVSQSRPIAASQKFRRLRTPSHSQALAKRANGDLVAINGVASPAAEYLRSQRTWQGLGSDFQIRYEEEDQEGSTIREGRSGIARAYTVGESNES